MVNYCCVCRVERSVITSDLTFHSLPRDKDIRNQWLKVLNKGFDVKQLLVCSNHFKPEDYRDNCQKPLLKKEAIPRFAIFFADTREESVENEKIIPRSKYCAIEMDNHKETQENVHDTCNFISGPDIESSALTKNTHNLKRKTDDHFTNKRCNLNTYGTFRRDDFKDEVTWYRFFKTVRGMREEILLLKRKNVQLHKEIENFKDILRDLKKNK